MDVEEVIQYTLAEGIATLTFNRPQVMNALDMAMLQAFPRICARARDDAGAKVIVLRGAGPAFIAGGDVAMFKANLHNMQSMVPELASVLRQGILTLRDTPKPVIASVHGAVAGAGLSIMLAADLIVAAEGTQFTSAFAKIGVSCDGGASWFLPRVAGYHKAMEMLLLADACTAQELQAQGIINRLVPKDELQATTLKLAQRLAAAPANVSAEIKRLVNNQQNQTLSETLSAEAQAFARCAMHVNFAEGVSAFVEKRKAKFL